MKNKEFISISLKLDERFLKELDAHADRLKIARTRLIQSVIEGLTESQIDAASQRGMKVIVETRTEYFENRKNMRERLASVSKVDMEKFLKQAEKRGS